ncbi:hydroxyisourate hydrolase [Metabacillus halosaccharovorans]|uniref:hydroxyisourate hydrolase n=1 Tax=Metabacillus halosaccharovorans TaxID=930124 RepID=UPI0020417025|nr:hydroxyisourate hydrolase [Metabacillus halosaccharovorans]MCM3440568.1 hydroxyisourate hydrolase [Metabacillus halosaccharovorans]
MTGLTTHILDLTHGIPAADVLVQLLRLEDEKASLIKSVRTNGDGRIDLPLLSVEEMWIGEYELLFFIGDYFRGKELPLPEPAFLDKVSIRFGVADVNAHYHVPLLVSPWGYQVYRGS